MSQPDLDGFPVLRIDQIPIIDSETLKKSIHEAIELVNSLTADLGAYDGQPKLVYYLNKQVELTKKELANRAASERVAALLRGATDIFQNYDEIAKSPVKFHEVEQSVPDNSPQHQEYGPTPTLITKGEELTSRPKSDSQAQRRDDLNTTIKTEQLRRIEHHPTVGAATKPWAEEDNDTSKQPSHQLSSRSNDESPQKSSESKKPKKRPQSGGSQPSVRAVLAMQQNFGNAFMVGATERRVRFYPKKAPVESEQEIKARERLER